MAAAAPTPLRVLIVEDSAADTDLLLRELRRGNYAPSFRRVDSEPDLADALQAQEWDLVLCDYTMAGFSGTRALSVVRARGLDMPLIFVSGTLGEETAVAALRAGAQDYVVKDNLKRLLPAIERELREAQIRRERARAEAGRQAAEARFRNLLAMAPDAIIAVDDRSCVTIFNRAAEELFGYAADEIAGRPLDLLLPADLLPPAPEAGGGAAARRVVEPREIAARRRNGDTFPAEASVSQGLEDRGADAMVIVRDLSLRHLLEEQLRQSQKMEVIGHLTGGLAHDFNNLLTVIIGNLDALEEAAEPGTPTARLARLALEAGLRGAELTRKLLAFSRRQSLEARPVDLAALVGGTADLLRRTLGEQIEVRTSLADDLPPALADPVQVEAALMNLAINARDAMPNGGRLTIETAGKILDTGYAARHPEVAPGAYAMLAVTDTGQGIPPEVLRRVFEPFFTTKESGKGTGLGLSMVYGFARQSGGHVQLYSEPGRGTTARLYLPLAVPGADPAGQALAAEAGETAAPQAVTILVVEDDPEVRAVAVTLVRSLGYAVLEAADGRQALELLGGAQQVDLLFTDMVMPGGLSGADLAREARRLRPGLPVLLTSGYAEAALLHDAGAEVADHLLGKPYRKAELAQRLRELLAAARSNGAAG